MGLFRKFSQWHKKLSGHHQEAARKKSASFRRCRVEAVEPRRMLAADIVLAAVYVETDLGNDTQPDIIEISFQGGAPGTELTRIVINGDKFPNGISSADIIFDTEPGGLGDFASIPYHTIKSDGFEILNVYVVDGGSQIIFDLSGFNAGEKLIFGIDVDEVNYVDQFGNIQVNSLVEGAEFENTIITGTFKAPHYEDLELTGTFKDFYDQKFAEVQALTGVTIDAPPDRYNDPPGDDMSNRTAGAVAHAKQTVIPARISGFVYHDRNNNGLKETGEEGLAGVTINIISVNTVDGSTVNKTTTTDANGYYEFTDLLPGTYRVVEVNQPANFLDGKDTPGTVGGVTRGVSVTPDGDELQSILLNGGDAGINYNFGEILPGSISGRVHGDPEGDCFFGPDDIPLEGVRIDLFDASDNLIATTYTDSNGQYRFDNLAPGVYKIFEHQPDGWLDSGDHVGTAGGTKIANDTIGNIVLAAGQHGENYDFCEEPPVNISGHVYHDRNNNGIRQAGEEGIPGVTLILLNFNNQEVARTTTDANGYYEFTNLPPGVYSIVELHPTGWIDGLDTPGNRGGTAQNPGDRISNIVLVGFLDGINYDFGELKPGSISGRVHADKDGDCEVDPDEELLEGVIIHLLDADGNILKTTTTDANGYYKFDNLAPGVYGIQEIQPDGYFHQAYHIGSGGGTKVKQDNIMDIHIGSGMDLVDYNFCETPPAQISGYVFQDGPAIINPGGVVPSNIYDIRDGVRTADDKPIAGVVLELRHGVTGEPIDASQALPGIYAAGPIRVTTDANGYYQFTGLKSGNYAVYQVHPDGYIDNLDTPGTFGGLAVNANKPINPLILSQLGVNSPNNDAILRIAVGPGDHSRENNFSEILVLPEVPQLPPDNPEPPPSPPVLGAPRLDPNPQFLPPPPVNLYLPELYSGSAAPGYTWHLSVIDAGQPRSKDQIQNLVHLTSSQFDALAWRGRDLNQSAFNLYEAVPGGNLEFIFGHPDAIPVTGDFNGDGITNVGVYIRGEWFIDLNGNGVWDEGDLWAKLGSEADRPVTGDWDGDGKDDIGIFGPEWAGDPKAVRHEPGLPDPENAPTGRQKNTPPTVEEATIGHRTMKLTSQGRLRTDLIDHVFYYGSAEDVPITGDWNGDGIKTIGLFRQGEWILDTDGNGRLTKADLTVRFGQPGDIPVVGDWNGDGIDKIGVYRGGKWIVDSNGNHTIDAMDQVFEHGGPSDLPIVGDWNGDGVDQPGVYQRHVEKTARAEN